MSRKKQKIVLPLDSFKRGSLNLRPGQCIMLRPSTQGEKPYLAKIEKIELHKVQQTQQPQQHPHSSPGDKAAGRGGSSAGSDGEVMLLCRWFYRPEDAKGGRRSFHGSKEIFSSNHTDRCYPEAVECECHVYDLKKYSTLRTVKEEDFFCRFHYDATTHALTPDRVAVYCKCEMPFNPDRAVWFCNSCQDLFHAECIGMPAEPSNPLKGNNIKGRFECPECREAGARVASEADVRRQTTGNSAVALQG